MTITIEKESVHNSIAKKDGTQQINKRPFVAEFVLGKDKKVSKNFLKPTFTSYLGGKVALRNSTSGPTPGKHLTTCLSQ